MTAAVLRTLAAAASLLARKFRIRSDSRAAIAQRPNA
jgi:hypothetical protein